MSTLSEIRHKCEQVIEATMRCKDVVPRETYEMYLRRMHKRPDVVPPKEVVDLLNRGSSAFRSRARIAGR